MQCLKRMLCSAILLLVVVLVTDVTVVRVLYLVGMNKCRPLPRKTVFCSLMLTALCKSSRAMPCKDQWDSSCSSMRNLPSKSTCSWSMPECAGVNLQMLTDGHLSKSPAEPSLVVRNVSFQFLSCFSLLDTRII